MQEVGDVPGGGGGRGGEGRGRDHQSLLCQDKLSVVIAS